MNKKKTAIILGAVLVAAVAAAGIWYFFKDGGKDSKDRVFVEKVSNVIRNATGVQNRYTGVVQPQETVEVNADSERTVSEVLVEVGDAVEAGTPLFQYDTEDLSLELQQEKLELENQDIEISGYKAQIAELEKERAAAAEANKFEYTTQIQTIQTQIKQAEFTKSSKQLEIDKIQKKVDNSQVLSTASGVIKSINDGQSQDEESSAFITILSTGEYRIKGTVNEQNVDMISTGADVIVRSRVDETITWEGIIDKLDTDEGPEKSADEEFAVDSGDGSTTSSSNYAFYVSMADAEGLMLGQHVLIELDNGQTEEKEGIWLFSGYIAFEGQEGNAAGGVENNLEMPGGWSDTEMPVEFEEGTEMALLANSFYDDGESMTMGTEAGMGMGMSQEGAASSAYVWADDGNGKLEKRSVELGEYDEILDKYEIISGLTEDDLIAWPMEGLYEGVRTVTDMEEVDYSSDLYNQEGGTEDLWFDTENNGLYDEEIYGTEIYDEDFDNDYSDDEYYEDGDLDEDDYADDGSGDEYDDDGREPAGTDSELTDTNGKKTLDLDDFLRMEGIQ